jgi:phosphoesterase family protein
VLYKTPNGRKSTVTEGPATTGRYRGHDDTAASRRQLRGSGRSGHSEAVRFRIGGRWNDDSSLRCGLDLPNVPRSAATTPVDHVVMIVMENKEYASIIGSGEAPYINSLACRFALAQRYYATSHPSLPNYLELIAGTNFGVTDDREDRVLHGRTLVD